MKFGRAPATQRIRICIGYERTCNQPDFSIYHIRSVTNSRRFFLAAVPAGWPVVELRLFYDGAKIKSALVAYPPV